MFKRVSILMLAFAAPAVAQTPAPPTAQTQPAAPAAKENPLDKVVCRTEETLGSRLKKHKVCATLREWQEQEQENRDAVELYQQRGQAVVPSGM